MSGFWTCHECGAEMYGFENCQFCGAHKGGGEAMSVLEPSSNQLEPTRWHSLFGTPERAANTILALQICPMSKDECEFCPAHDVCFEFYKDGRTVYEMAEWLRGDA